MRAKAESLRAGAEVLRNDGSDGVTLATGVDSSTYQEMGGSAGGAAMVQNNEQSVTVNTGHSVWESSGKMAQFSIGHESLHSAGLNDQKLDGVKAAKFGDRDQRAAYRRMRDTPQADVNPDHLMDEVY
jgi:hypothetical protein